jgi:hypothetical protein
LGDAEHETDFQKRRDEPAEEQPPPERSPLLLEAGPWLISVVIHGGLVVLTCFVIWRQVVEREQSDVVPALELGQTAEAPLQLRETELERERAAESPEATAGESTDSPEPSSELEAEVETETELIGSEGASGNPAPFGTASEAGQEEQVKFFGLKGDARRVVFLIDATGSLIDTLPFVIEELKRAIQRLSPQQEFTVIFFRGENVFDQSVIEVPVPAPGWKSATRQVKASVADWIDLGAGNVEPGGKATPVEAVERALNYEPDLVVLLSDDITGSGPTAIDQQQLLEKIEELSAGRVRINTIQFLYRDPLAEAPGKEGTMKLIAERTGGRHKFVDQEELIR